MRNSLQRQITAIRPAQYLEELGGAHKSSRKFTKTRRRPLQELGYEVP